MILPTTIPEHRIPPARTRLFQKHPANPIVTAEQMPGDVMYLFNPGVIKHGGAYVMLADAATLAQPIVLWLLRSADGVRFVPDAEPVAWPEPPENHPEDCVYDPRITRIGDDYIICYASGSVDCGVRVGIVRTRDFRRYERVAIASELGNRNAILFPEKINGLYCRLDRPFGNPHEPSGAWISWSPDLVYWGNAKPLLMPRKGLWDDLKVGGGAVPIKTDAGWLELYHGVTRTGGGVIYRLGVCLLDLKDPAKVIARGEDAVLWPEHDYEMLGRVPNVVFSCNAIPEAGGTVKVYYGAADTCIGLAEAKLDDLVRACFSKNKYLADAFRHRA